MHSLEFQLSDALENASRSARSGNLNFQIYLGGAKVFARELGRDISAQIAMIESVGIKKAVPALLQEARREAERGDVNYRTSLGNTQYYAPKVGKDVSAEVAKIELLYQG